MNLLKETKEILRENNKKIEDIKWIGTDICFVDIEKFIEIANVDYDDSYGSEEVAVDLLIVGDNWWLERHEYDGAEWWEYKTLPTLPNQKLELKSLTTKQSKELGFKNVGGCAGLIELNGINEEKLNLEVKKCK